MVKESSKFFHTYPNKQEIEPSTNLRLLSFIWHVQYLRLRKLNHVGYKIYVKTMRILFAIGEIQTEDC